jgi:uncharacterized protein (TIGR03437 family)
MKFRLSIAVFSCVLASLWTEARAGVNFWTPLGPNLGWVEAIAFDPRQPLTIYQQVSQEGFPLFKSTDGGATFSIINSGCSGVPQFDPRNADHVYALCGALSISTDGGRNWRYALGSVSDFALDPNDSQVLYASGFGNPQYAGFSGAIYKSLDGGVSWSRILETQSGGISQIEIDPQDSRVLLAADSRGNILKSVDSGITWTTRPVGGPLYPYSAALEIDPRHPSFVVYSTAESYSAPDFVARSFDGGETWQRMRLPGVPNTQWDRWIYGFAFDPLIPGTLYAGGGGGVIRSTDWGATWTDMSDGLVEHRFTDRPAHIHLLSLAIDPNNPQRLLAGTADGLFEITLSPAAAQVTSGGVVNAASFANPVMPNGAIARGSLFTVFDPRVADYPEVAHAFPLPTTLGGEQYSMQISVGGATADAIMLWAGYGQVNAILPSSLPSGEGVLRIFGGGMHLATHSIRVVDRSFGIFTQNSSGSGVGAVQNEGPDRRLSDNSLFNAARPGQVAVLWGTGLGPVFGNEAAGSLPGDILSPDVHVWVDGKDATLLYGGRSGCCAGVDQINFIVPEGVEGCYLPVAVQIGNIVSNYVSMSISASGGTCSAP